MLELQSACCWSIPRTTVCGKRFDFTEVGHFAQAAGFNGGAVSPTPAIGSVVCPHPTAVDAVGLRRVGDNPPYLRGWFSGGAVCPTPHELVLRVLWWVGDNPLHLQQSRVARFQAPCYAYSSPGRQRVREKAREME